MFCKYFKTLFAVLLFIVMAWGKMDMHLTEDQKYRIHDEYFKKDVKNEKSVFDKRSRYLYKIIHSRPENLDLQVDQKCKIEPLKMPDFAALNDNYLRISEVKCLENLWKIRYYEEINIAAAVQCLNNDDADELLENITDSHIPGKQYSEYPHMGAIGWESSKNTWLFMCDGALISEKHVLTTAQCTQLPHRYTKQVIDLKPKVVRFGVYDISDKEEYRKLPIDILISKITQYPNYKPDLYYNDIAIIEIAKEIVFSSMIHPACIWTNLSVVTDIGLLAGWYVVESNKTNYTNKIVETATSLSDFNVFNRFKLYNRPKPKESTRNGPINEFMMQLAKVKLIPNIKCTELIQKTVYKEKSRWYGLLYQHQCEYSCHDKKICQTKRGTVLQARIKIPEITDWKMQYVIALRSFEFGYERSLSIYTRVSAYLDWIENIVWPKAV